MPEQKTKTTFTYEQALQKARNYCAKQERAHAQLRNKLYDWGLFKNEVEKAISQLIVEGFLSEQRFANAYVSGKFNIKKWGKRKIAYELTKKQVPKKLAMQAINSIDENSYKETIAKLIVKKNSSLQDDFFTRKNKIARYLLSKGYENEVIWQMIENTLHG
jgi:regulatory protein